MQYYITKEQKHLLWKDEIGDTFLLLKDGEVFEYSNTVARVHSWNSRLPARMQKIAPIFNEWATDDHLYIFDINMSDLSKLIAISSTRRRPDLNGKWLKNKEKRLAHQIIPFNPNIV